MAAVRFSCLREKVSLHNIATKKESHHRVQLSHTGAKHCAWLFQFRRQMLTTTISVIVWRFDSCWCFHPYGRRRPYSCCINILPRNQVLESRFSLIQRWTIFWMMSLEGRRISCWWQRKLCCRCMTSQVYQICCHAGDRRSLSLFLIDPWHSWKGTFRVYWIWLSLCIRSPFLLRCQRREKSIPK